MSPRFAQLLAESVAFLLFFGKGDGEANYCLKSTVCSPHQKINPNI